ncbi:Uncharacterized conserved protein [Modicisalibacter ilicicola DSM 19980]|uniref:Uncharacterized conserved protein n=1 Tax=Modicisalibacter ilicicola DSM 19980 TaxID=1121942 RepID=A0A1M5ACK9_9GAMM|nr:GFA family protein [Halomonas ilicicola]SHF28030.1 Uncharacterized conserved protein [Halomonas ilicicola DSM 19980]
MVNDSTHGSTHESSYTGRCFCGAVELAVRGEPVAMGYCHCDACRSWSAGPVNAFTLWKPENVRITKGADNVAGFQKTEKSLRKWCQCCGGHLLTEHPPWGVVDVYAAMLPALTFTPSLHVHYREAVLPVRDGLPKQRDLSTDMGGTGILLPE